MRTKTVIEEVRKKVMVMKGGPSTTLGRGKGNASKRSTSATLDQ